MRIGGESLVFTWWVVFSLVLRTHVVVGALLKERERKRPKNGFIYSFSNCFVSAACTQVQVPA